MVVCFLISILESFVDILWHGGCKINTHLASLIRLVELGK